MDSILSHNWSFYNDHMTSSYFSTRIALGDLIEHLLSPYWLSAFAKQLATSIVLFWQIVKWNIVLSPPRAAATESSVRWKNLWEFWPSSHCSHSFWKPAACRLFFLWIRGSYSEKKHILGICSVQQTVLKWGPKVSWREVVYYDLKGKSAKRQPV